MVFKIQNLIHRKKIAQDTIIDLDTLKKTNILNKSFDKLKVLGSGEIKEKFEIEVNYISSSAKEKIEKSGGKVSLIK